MNKLERIRAAVRREPVDRMPYAVWCHFPDVDRSTVGLTQATLRFHQRYGSDFLKVTPPAGYAVEDWGCVESDSAQPDGNRPCASHAVTSAADWDKIRPLDISASAYGRHLETLVRIMMDPRADAPVLPTVFSPLSLARKLSGKRLNQDLQERPETMMAALEAITETLTRFVDRCLDEGAAGIFFAIQAASAQLHTEEEYARFGEPYDRRILEATMARASLVILHAHGHELMFPRLAALPAHAWNWDDRIAGPSLKEGKRHVRGAVIGGLNQQGTLKDGTPEEIQSEVMDAVDQTAGIGLIVGPGCVVPPAVPDEHMVTMVRALGGSIKLTL